MEKLAITCKLLYNQELLEIKKELRNYKKRFDIPKIIITVNNWIYKSREAHDILRNTNNLDDMLKNTKKILKHLYDDEYYKYKLFFKEQLKQLKESLKILINIVDFDYILNDVFDYTWHFLNALFDKVNWMYCGNCKEHVKTCIGLCNVCDIYTDNSDMLADMNDH